MLQKLIFLFVSLIGLSTAQSPVCAYSQYLQPGGKSFLIQSPGYPTNTYPPGSSCIWRAFTNQNARISLECPFVDLPQNGVTCVDTLIVSDTENPNDGVIYCGRTKIYHDSIGTALTIQINAAPNSPGGRFSCNIRAYNISTSVPTQPNCACGYSFRSRIVGGTETGINEFPFMAGIVSISLKDILCGATIVTERFSVSAAHCLKGRDINDIALVVGEHDISTGKETNATKLIKVVQIYLHPQYDATTTTNDVAVLQIGQKLVYNSRVGPACLPFNHPETHVGEFVQVVGWGSTEFGGVKAERLQKATVKVVPITDCQQTFGAKVYPYGQLCTFGGNKDACQYDSGGPVLWVDPVYNRYMLIGVLSYGRGCALNYPSVNTRVFAYLGWIESIISSDFYCVV